MAANNQGRILQDFMQRGVHYMKNMQILQWIVKGIRLKIW